MLYPLIYTRTKYHDYRIVTSKSLAGLPHSVVQLFTEVARTMIDAENSQLGEPSWALVKKNGYILWGMSILNDVLGEDNKDKYKRPVRGFFGLISDSSTNKLPYSISYFKEIYKEYVMPIWDSPEQTEQISSQPPAISGDEFITKSTLLSRDINVELGMCRIFPNGSDCKSLIEAVFASFEDCSIATNIHKKSQCVEFGKDKLSFMNVAGASDLGIRNEQDIKVYVKEEPVLINDNQVKDDSKPFEDSTCTRCGKPVFGDNDLCSECRDNKKNETYLKYGLYGFITIVCLVLIFKGPSIWEAILSPKHNTGIVNQKEEIGFQNESGEQNVKPFLITIKPVFNIEDADPDQYFKIQYHSSSNIQKVQPSDAWIHIITPAHQYSKSGDIEFACEAFNQGSRDGSIKLINADDEKCIIQVHQTNSNQHNHDPNIKGIQDETPPQAALKVVFSDRNSPSSSNTEEKENTEVELSAEGTN